MEYRKIAYANQEERKANDVGSEEQRIAFFPQERNGEEIEQFYSDKCCQTPSDVWHLQLSRKLPGDGKLINYDSSSENKYDKRM